jgi:hypothetical protein
MWGMIWIGVAIVLTFAPDVEWGAGTLWLLIPFAFFSTIAYETGRQK